MTERERNKKSKKNEKVKLNVIFELIRQIFIDITVCLFGSLFVILDFVAILHMHYEINGQIKSDQKQNKNEFY